MAQSATHSILNKSGNKEEKTYFFVLNFYFTQLHYKETNHLLLLKLEFLVYKLSTDKLPLYLQYFIWKKYLPSF